MNKSDLRLLLVEDVPADAELIQYELRRANISFEAKCVASRRAFLNELRSQSCDAIISDFSMPQFNALDALHVLKAQRLEVPFILVTGSQSEEVAVECIKEGADDYILKSSLKRLPSALLSAIHKKQAERDREEAQERVLDQAALLNKARDAIMVLDLNGIIMFWNKSAEQLYGWKNEELLGHGNADLLYSSDLSKQTEARDRTLSEGDWQGEMKQVARDGKEILVESRWSLVRDRENKPRSFLIINTDITERKKLEVHFLRAQRMESIGTLAGGIAHDLNNVFTPILMSLKLLRELKDQAPDEIIETLETSAHRGAAIVQQVLSFARGVEGERAVLQVKHPLNEVIKIAKDLFPPSIQIRSHIPSDLWPVTGDPTQLHQVFMNLFVNARDAMPNGGRLQVDTQNVTLDENYARMQPESKPGRYVLVNVADTGTGISSELINKIFEPFFTTKEIGKGTGLGLSTAVGIIRSHGGFINVYSEIGKGSSFKIYLPACDSVKTEKRSGADHDLPPGRGECVLVVDDEAAIREIIKVTLETNGYKVVTATDGAEAVAIFASKSKKFKAVIVDVMMPFMDGPSTIRAIQRLDPQMKFVTISGLMDQSRISQLSEIGNVTFLAKPFTTEQILRTLHDVLK